MRQPDLLKVLHADQEIAISHTDEELSFAFLVQLDLDDQRFRCRDAESRDDGGQNSLNVGARRLDGQSEHQETQKTGPPARDVALAVVGEAHGQRHIAASTFKNMTVFTLVALLYLAMSLPLTYLAHRLERAFGRK